jgi:hypothetical protein
MACWKILAALAVLIAPSLALAQPSDVSEVVVTSEKRDQSINRVALIPHVVLRRRADNLITSVRVVCDTRDPAQRRNELKATLRNMIKASGGQIELGLGEGVIGRFDDSMLDRVIEPDRRADTSQAVVVVKTHVTATDTFDTAAGRITRFIEHTPKVGRAEILREEEWSLTIIDPEQYRTPIIAKVAQDAQATAQAFGAGYGVAIEGLQGPVDWYQSAPLDLALYIPYRMTVQALPK